jgi:hypothetical protein
MSKERNSGAPWMMSLFNHPRTGCQALETPRKGNLFCNIGLTLLLSLFSWLSIAGCSGLAGQKTPPGNGQLSTSPGSVTFGDVEVGTSSAQTVRLSNSGSASLTVSQAGVSGTGFTTTGVNSPLTLPTGQSSSLSVQFAPTVTGSVSGSVSVVSNASNSPTMIALSANGVRHQLSLTPISVSFGSLAVGTTVTQTILLTNSGTTSLNISQGSVTGGSFSMSGLSFPIVLAQGQSVTLSVQFAPAAIGSASGSVTLVSNARSSPDVVPLTGTGIPPASGQVTPNPSSLIFGNVIVSSTSVQSVTLANTGSSAVTVSQVTVSGTGFSISGPTLPLTIAAGQSSSLSVQFAPTVIGSISGNVTVVSNASNSPTTISLSGAGVQPQISVVPASVSFGNVIVGLTNTQTMTLSNPGSANLSVSQATMTGAGFVLSGLTLPLNVAPGQSTTFTVSFTPTVASSATGSLSLVSNAPGSPLTVALSGTGVAPILQLSANPASWNFRNVTVGSSGTQTVTLSNTGNSSVTISQVTASGAGFSSSGLTPPLTLTAGQSTTFSVIFAPAAAGSLTGSVTVVSNASNSPTTIALSGTGVQVISHSVTLAWDPSTSVVAGYNIYRGTLTGGPYTKLNATPVSLTTYLDNAVQSGLTYFYVATAVDSSNVESVLSNEISATIP